ncbi:MAG: hypothetical protein QOE90_3531 [Thermoplasmata archaeon]|jgi:hypothetical protein|nr:hypothetical protein [Thermoplasmata archaeon]
MPRPKSPAPVREVERPLPERPVFAWDLRQGTEDTEEPEP